MGTIKAVAFDLEGTLIDVEEVHRIAWRIVAGKIGISNFDIVSAGLLGAGDTAISLHLAAESRTDQDDLIRLKRQEYRRLLASTPIDVRVGFIRCLRLICEKKFNLHAIASLTPQTEAEYLLDKASLSSFPWKSRLFADDVRNVKPAPDVYLMTAERLNVQPYEMLVFEDSVTGVKAARAAGSPVVAVPVYYEETCAALRDAGAATVVRSWKDVDLKTLLNIGQSLPLIFG